MKDILLRAAGHRNEIGLFLGMIDLPRLQRGQLLVNSKMLDIVIKTLVSNDMNIKASAFGPDGSILLDAVTNGGMEFEYTFRLTRLEIANGTADAYATYTEVRKNGGLGGALLNLTGKSGLSFAFAKYNWIKADGKGIWVRKHGLPDFIGCSFVRSSHEGLLLRVF